PPIDERIRILRQLSGASYTDYQKTFGEVTHRDATLIPGSALADDTMVPFRAAGQTLAAAASPILDSPEFKHKSGDIIRAANGFRFINCGCGMKFKIPPGFSHPAVKCSKCGTIHNL
ncbi:MAG: zinc ribbon domain-containing protein, partial [Bacteroidales bacterium]